MFRNINLYNRKPIYKVHGMAVRSMGAEELLQLLAVNT